MARAAWDGQLLLLAYWHPLLNIIFRLGFQSAMLDDVILF